MSIQPVGANTAQYAPQSQGVASQGSVAARRAQTPQEVAASSGVTPGQPGSRPQPTPEELTQAVQQIQNVLPEMARSLQFSIDKDLGVAVVKVIDKDSNKVIRQIPSEEVLQISKALDKLQGLLVKQQA